MKRSIRRGLAMKARANRRCDQRRALTQDFPHNEHAQRDDLGDAHRNDSGFSFAQVIVTMIILGVLATGVGLTVFGFIGESRETILANNIRTAAQTVQNVLTLQPGLKGDGGTAKSSAASCAAVGELSDALIAELGSQAPFVWTTGTAGTVTGSAACSTTADAGVSNWEFGSTDDVNVVRVQFIQDDTTAASATGGTAAGDDAAPTVTWLLDDGDAVRMHIRNVEGDWACALVVLRPTWTVGATTVENTQMKSMLGGIWYDSGSVIADGSTTTTDAENGGRHDCSPSVAAGVVGNSAGSGRTAAATILDPVPGSLAEWDIETATAEDVEERNLRRSVPEFAS